VLFSIAARWVAASASSLHECRNAVLALANPFGHPHPERLAMMLFSSGKALPSDAGKYNLCVNQPHARYFLVVINASNIAFPGGMPMGLGLCVPDACDHDGVTDLVHGASIAAYVPELLAFKRSVMQLSSPQLDVKDPGAGYVATVSCVAVLALLVIVSTAVTLYRQSSVELPLQQRDIAGGERLLDGQTPQQAAWRLPLIDAFSLIGRTGTIKTLKDIPQAKATDCLNGLRVISMAMIILFHTSQVTGKEIAQYQNAQDIVMSQLNPNAYETSWWMVFVLNAQNAVDSFFFLSGFLLAFLTLPALRQGRFKLMQSIVLRYLRLTPSFALVLFLYWKVLPHLGQGPFSPILQQSTARCDGSWWSALTYTMNFYPFDPSKMCMGWTWYLGDDMIFFIVTSLILPIYAKKRWLGWMVLLLLTGISFGVTMMLVTRHKLGVYIFDYHYEDYSYWAYSRSYTRIPAYFVGVAAAWLLDELEHRGITRNTRPDTARARALASIAAFAAAAVLLLITFLPVTDFGSHKNSWDDMSPLNALWITLFRPVWSACLAVVTLLCYYGYLPTVNGFLAHPIWTPFARLTYGAYLLHPLVSGLAGALALQFKTFTWMGLLDSWAGTCLLGYLGSFLLWVLVERPCMTIFSPAKGRKVSEVRNTCSTPRVSPTTSSSCNDRPEPEITLIKD
jgi:peptidoglycan/LPS O-acetylase OafA/YrhL